MKSVIVLTGSELRHQFLRKYLGSLENLTVLRTYCEGIENNLTNIVLKQENTSSRMNHLDIRDETERDFFQLFCEKVADKSNSLFIKKGEINEDAHVNDIINLNPDIIVSYGCSIIKPPLIEAFKGRFLNLHLGLSPYYRGSGTNFWPFVNNEPEYVGVTFMHIDAGIDTGEIIHQIRPRIMHGDNIHQIGNRLISDMAKVCGNLISKFENIEKMPQPEKPLNEKYYKKKDFSEESVSIMYKNFSNGLVEKYLNEKPKRDSNVPIVENPSIV